MESENHSSGLRIDRSLTIPEGEIEYRFTTSGGPGGQHANRSSTRVELIWNVDRSSALSPRQRARIKEELRHRIDSSGDLRVASGSSRSQMRNRQEARRRLQGMVQQALAPRRTRTPTRATASSQRRRLEQKRRRSDVKRLRRSPARDE